jgi:hypothetical protein
MSDKLTVLRLPRQPYDEAKGQRELDPVTVFIEDFEPGRGQLTVVCWGRAWTHFWGAMGNGSNVARFVSKASTGYIVDKLMLTRDVMFKSAEHREERWLTQIVEALKNKLREEAQ